jgi:type II secretory pathway pseudopilin PulG
VIAREKNEGFTLIEVVMAMGIFVFAGIALVGLLAVGLRSGSDSKQRFQAASIAETICSTRRAAPTVDFTASGSTQPGFPLPKLNQGGNLNNISPLNPVYLNWAGSDKNASGNPITASDPSARFGLLYSIIAPANYVPSTSPGVATVYLDIYWPALAPPTSAGTSHFEMTTTFALP